MATKRALVEQWRKEADQYQKLHQAYADRATWDNKLSPVTRAAHYEALAQMAFAHAMQLDTSYSLQNV